MLVRRLSTSTVYSPSSLGNVTTIVQDQTRQQYLPKVIKLELDPVCPWRCTSMWLHPVSERLSAIAFKIELRLKKTCLESRVVILGQDTLTVGTNWVAYCIDGGQNPYLTKEYPAASIEKLPELEA
jgi:hypothetical protein